MREPSHFFLVPRRSPGTDVLLLMVVWTLATWAAEGPVTVVTETFLGSEGTEWLSGGAFLPDNKILLGGVSVDPEMTLGGVKAGVIGLDAPVLPEIKAWRRLGEVPTGKVAVPTLDQTTKPGADIELKTEAEVQAEKKRKTEEAREVVATPRELGWRENDTVESATVYRKVAWCDREATGFLAVLGPDLKQVLSLRRLPRGAGSITGLELAADGSVYIVGGATERIATISANVKHLPAIVPIKDRPASLCPWIYVAKLSADLSQVIWLRTAPADSLAPRLRVLRSGDVTVSSPEIRVFAPDGELRRSLEVSRARNPSTVTFNPVSGRYAKGGDFLTVTGREPYRTPYIFIFNPDGSLELELMRWRGAFVGLDSLRLVADAQVEKLIHDNDGNLLAFSRSHGGNCVQIRYPYDIDRFMPNGLKALPMRSPGVVVKLGLDFNVIGAGVWGDPGFVKAVGFGADGSAAWTGQAKDGLIACVASPKLDERRYTKVLTAWGRRVAAAGDDEDCAIVTGKLNGRPMLMFLSGAVARGETGDRKPPPLENAVQPTFAGGLLDGHVILLDLSPTPVNAPAAPPGRKPVGEKQIVETGRPLVATEGQKFRLGGEKYLNLQVTLREQPETGLWPRFWRGRADKGGSFTFSTKEMSPASFSLRAEGLEQADGNQDRRLFGAQMVSNVWLEVTKMSAWELQERREEREDSIRVSHQPVCKVDGRLHWGDREIEVTSAPCSGGFSVPRGVNPKEASVQPNQVGLRIEFNVNGKELGIASDKTGKFRFACTGYSDVKYEALEPVRLPKMEDAMELKPKDEVLQELEK